MKRKIWAVIAVLLVILLAAGVVFCIQRPEYVREAIEILFKNELR